MLSQSQKEVTIFTKHKTPHNITFVLDDIIVFHFITRYNLQTFCFTESLITSESYHRLSRPDYVYTEQYFTFFVRGLLSEVIHCVESSSRIK